MKLANINVRAVMTARLKVVVTSTAGLVRHVNATHPILTFRPMRTIRCLEAKTRTLVKDFRYAHC